MPEQCVKSGDGHQAMTASHSVVFSCFCIPCVVGCRGIEANTLKLIGISCTALVLIFSAIVVGVINSSLSPILHVDGYYHYSLKDSNCEYARFCGGFSIALSLIFGAIYGLRIKPIVAFPFLGTKAQLIGEICAAAITAIFFGVCAIVLSTATVYSPYAIDASRAVSAFSYLATCCWVGLANAAYMFYQGRESEASSPGNNTL